MDSERRVFEGWTDPGKDPLLEFSNSIQLANYNVRYFKVGTGPHFIFIFPGLVNPVSMLFVPFLEKMQAEHGLKYTIVTWDRPGYFGSKPPRRMETDFNFAKDVELCKILLDTLGISRVTILGYSAGSQAAVSFALAYPLVVHRLFLWGCLDLMDETELKQHDKMSQFKYHVGPSADIILQDFDGNKVEAFKHMAAWYEFIRQEFSGKDPIHWKKRYAPISCPTLIIHGEKDPRSTIRMATQLHHSIEGSTYIQLKNGTHECHYTAASRDSFVIILNHFLSDQTVDTLEIPNEFTMHIM